MSMKRIILTTGGTGGHIFPALAVADELRRRNPGIDLLFMGGAGPEGDLARKHGIAFQELPAKGIMGKGLSGMLSGLGWLGAGIPKAMGAVKRFGPDAVIGFGGYAGFCPVLAAALLGIPTAVHEQNSVPGVTNKVLGKIVRKIFLSFRIRLAYSRRQRPFSPAIPCVPPSSRRQRNARGASVESAC